MSNLVIEHMFCLGSPSFSYFLRLFLVLAVYQTLNRLYGVPEYPVSVLDLYPLAECLANVISGPDIMYWVPQK